MLTGLPMLMGATSRVGGISWVVGAVYRIIQGRYGADGIVLSVLELKLDRSWRLVAGGLVCWDCHRQSLAVYSNERTGIAAKGQVAI